jgi:RNA polymerase sigma factor (sigma-70 family)
MVRRYRLDVYAWFCRRVRVAEDAEELTCQVFTDVWRKWSEYGPREPWPLLQSFASRLLYQHHRSKGRCARFLQRVEYLFGEPSSRALFDGVLEQAQRSARLELCLKALNPLLRRILELHYWGEQSDPEIAQALEADEGRLLSADAVKQRRLRVMPRLQTCLETEGEPHV